MALIFDREKTRQIRSKQVTGLAATIGCVSAIYRGEMSAKERKRGSDSKKTIFECIVSAVPFIYSNVRPAVSIPDKALVNDIVSEINHGRLKNLEVLAALDNKNYSPSIRASIRKAIAKRGR